MAGVARKGEAHMNQEAITNQLAAQSQFIDTYLALLEKHPNARIAVSDIVKDANYARCTFYRYFNNMDALKTAAMRSNTCIKQCLAIERSAASIPLEQATDTVATFYEDHAAAVATLVRCAFGNDYIDLQRRAMKPMFAALLSRAFDMTPLQLEIASDYIASAKAGMIRLWANRGQDISLNQINKLAESVVERDLWTLVAAKNDGVNSQLERQRFENKPFEYPWL